MSEKKLSVLFQIMDEQGDPVGLYAVPAEKSDEFEALFHPLEQKAWEEFQRDDNEHDDFQTFLDEKLWADLGVDRVYIEDDIKSRYINASF